MNYKSQYKLLFKIRDQGKRIKELEKLVTDQAIKINLAVKECEESNPSMESLIRILRGDIQ